MVTDNLLETSFIISDLELLLGKVKEIVDGAHIMRENAEHFIKALQDTPSENAVGDYEAIGLLQELAAQYESLFNLATSLSLAWNTPTFYLIRALKNYEYKHNV